MAGRHTIDYTTSGTTARWDDVSARAHTERIHTPSLYLRDQRIGRIAHQPDNLRRRVVIHQAIDKGLRVLHTHTHSKAFWLQQHTLGHQHTVGVVSGVPNSKNDGLLLPPPQRGGMQ